MDVHRISPDTTSPVKVRTEIVMVILRLVVHEQRDFLKKKKRPSWDSPNDVEKMTIQMM